MSSSQAQKLASLSFSIHSAVPGIFRVREEEGQGLGEESKSLLDGWWVTSHRRLLRDDAPKQNLFLLRRLRILGGHTVCSVTQPCLTLCNPRDCSLPGASVQWIFQARRLKWVVISYSRKIFPTQGWNLGLLHWQADSFITEPHGKLQGTT